MILQSNSKKYTGFGNENIFFMDMILGASN
jgi:hypothetical protein